jgi:hypothetical protein
MAWKNISHEYKIINTIVTLSTVSKHVLLSVLEKFILKPEAEEAGTSHTKRHTVLTNFLSAVNSLMCSVQTTNISESISLIQK